MNEDQARDQAEASLWVEAAECETLAEQLEKKHGAYLKGRSFAIEVAEQAGIVTATVTLSSADETFYYPVQGRLAYEQEELSKRDAALFMIDYIDLYFSEYFQEKEELMIPIDWTDYEWDAINFQLSGQVLNRKMEKLADELLASASPAESGI